MKRLLLSAVVLTAGTALAVDPPKQKWEYKVVPITGTIPAVKGDEKPLTLTEALNKMGQDGWELVGVGPGVRTVQGSADAGGFGGAAGGGGFGVGGLGGGGFGGAVGPQTFSEYRREAANQIWQSYARGQESVDLNAEQNARFKEMVIRQAGKIDDNVLTKEAFIKMMSERGQVGGRGENQPADEIQIQRIWDMVSRGREELDINEREAAALKRRFDMMTEYKLPASGKLTKDEFIKVYSQMLTEERQRRVTTDPQVANVV
jgi:hypothetical protein